MKNSKVLVLGIRWAVIFSALAFISTTGASEVPTKAPPKASGGRIEEIYIARSLRESRDKPTEWCSKSRAGFEDVTSEDHYTFRSIAVRPSDGRLVDDNLRMIGRLRACFGSTNNPQLQNFYAEGVIGNVAFKGLGECLASTADYPESGITRSRCFMHLDGLPMEYIGGELTTNSIRSRNVVGDLSDPPGYTQPSIATIRLWRRRT
jgi:hypothetical protein